MRNDTRHLGQGLCPDGATRLPRSFSLGGSPALVKKWNFANKQDGKRRREERRGRYRFRSALRPLLGDLVRAGSRGKERYDAGAGARNSFGFCGLSADYLPASPAIEVRSHGLERRASVKRVSTCSNAWVCPCCSPRIRSLRASEVEQATTQHLANGGGLAFLTLTVRHGKGDTLEELRRGISGAWSRVQASRTWRKLRDSGQVVGVVRAWDMTYSQTNGFHPHLHLLVFFESVPATSEVLALQRFLTVEWAESVRVKLGEARVPSSRRGVDFVAVGRTAGDAGAVSSYLAKVSGSAGLSAELLNPASAKVARPRPGGRGLSVWELLALAVEGEAWAVRASRELFEGVRGVYVVSWSRGLKKRFGIGEVADEDAPDPDAPEGSLLVEEVPLPADILTHLNASPEGVSPLLDLAERKGVPALKRRIEELTGQVRNHPPPRVRELVRSG